MERNLWRDGEIKALLNIIEKEKILDMINEKKYRNEQIFRFVETEMHSRGFTKKNYQQIWTKWKFLKSSYVTTTRHNSTPGKIPRTCDYYPLLDRILGKTDETNDDFPIIDSVPTSLVDANGETIQIKQEFIEDPDDDDAKPLIEPEPIITPYLRPATPIIHEVTIAHKSKRKQTKHNGKTKSNSSPSPPAPLTHPTITTNNNHEENKTADHHLSYNDDCVVGLNGLDDEPSSSKRKPLQGSYFRAMKELASNLRQMQRELIEEFFQKQEEMMRQEHEFQKRQDQVLLKSFEEQTRLLLDGARNLLSSGMAEMPDIVYINED